MPWLGRLANHFCSRARISRTRICAPFSPEQAVARRKMCSSATSLVLKQSQTTEDPQPWLNAGWAWRSLFLLRLRLLRETDTDHSSQIRQIQGQALILLTARFSPCSYALPASRGTLSMKMPTLDKFPRKALVDIDVQRALVISHLIVTARGSTSKLADPFPSESRCLSPAPASPARGQGCPPSVSAEDGEGELGTEVAGLGEAEALDEITVFATELSNALPQLLQVESAAEARAPHFGQTTKPAGAANWDGRGTPSIPGSLAVVSHFGPCPVNLCLCSCKFHRSLRRASRGRIGQTLCDRSDQSCATIRSSLD